MPLLCFDERLKDIQLIEDNKNKNSQNVTLNVFYTFLVRFEHLKDVFERVPFIEKTTTKSSKRLKCFDTFIPHTSTTEEAKRTT